MTPQDPVVGSTVLRRPAIQSPNYVAGTAGWTINSDGSAEFNNLTIRGTFAGTDFEINSGGAFFYSGTPAAGNLIISIANAAGSDAFANAYPKGISLGKSSDSSQVQLLTGVGGTGTAAEVAFPIPTLALSNTANIGSGIVSGTFADLVLSGPALSAAGAEDWAQIVMFSDSGATGDAHGELRYVDTSGNVTTVAAWGSAGFTAATITAIVAALSGQATTIDGLTDGTIAGTSASAGLANGQTAGTSGSASAGTAHTHGPGSYAVTSGQHSHTGGTFAVTDGTHSHDLPAV